MNRLGVSFRIALCLLAAAFAGCGSGGDGPGESLPRTEPRPTAVPTGSIRGRVRLQGLPPTPATDPISQDQATCGDSASLPRLVLGEDRGIQYAFVYLEGVGPSRGDAPPERISIDQQGCHYVPHALVARVGAELEIVNSDPILHNVHGTEAAEASRGRTVFNVAQPIQGHRTTIDSALTSPGIVHLTCQAGHPWMSAWVLVTDHPYATVTNEAGEFVISDVPIGTYTIKMWHEGVHLTRIVRSLQRFDYEDPYEIDQQVVVENGAETEVTFEVTLRPPPDQTAALSLP